MVGSTHEAAMSGTTNTFEDNRARRCKDLENAIHVVIFEVHDVTNVDSTGAAITERHFGCVCKFGAKIEKGDTMVSRLGSCGACTKEFTKNYYRKLLSLQRGVLLKTTKLKFESIKTSELKQAILLRS